MPRNCPDLYCGIATETSPPTFTLGFHGLGIALICIVGLRRVEGDGEETEEHHLGIALICIVGLNRGPTVPS